VVAPFVFRTYKARPTYKEFVPLTAQEKRNLAISLQNRKFCWRATSLDTDDDFVTDYLCQHDKDRFERGGDYEYHPDWLKYSAVNVAAAAATFVSVLGVVCAEN
jgi:hypothetical protein